MELLTVPLEVLVPDPTNPRYHPKENIEAIRRSLDRFGQAAPLVVHEPTSVVIAGNGTLEAMKALGWTECKAVLYGGTMDEARALSVALNQIPMMASWDENNLAGLLKDLQDKGFDGLSATGLQEKAIADLIAVSQGSHALSGMLQGPKASMADKFLVPPFSVLDARQGYWQERKRQWLALGIQSELGRGGGCGLNRNPDPRLTGSAPLERERERESMMAFTPTRLVW